MSNYDKINPKEIQDFSNIIYDISPSYSGIACGLSKGEVYTNDVKQPKIAVVYSEPVGGFSVLGKFETKEDVNDFEVFIKDELFPNLLEKGWEYFEFSTTEDSTLSTILSLFPDKCMESEIEYSFRMGGNIQDVIIPDGYQILPVDEQLLDHRENGNIENISMLKEIIDNSWDSKENFLSSSMAYVAVYNDRIVAVIVGTSRFHQFVPIDIVTEENHQKKGLASALTLAFLHECRKRGLIAQWDCVESNLASQKTAKKCGFKLFRERTYYWFKI